MTRRSRSTCLALLPGQTKATLAFLEENARWDEKGINIKARKGKKNYSLSGVKLFVPDAHVADVIVCAARTAEGISFFVVDRQQAWREYATAQDDGPDAQTL